MARFGTRSAGHILVRILIRGPLSRRLVSSIMVGVLIGDGFMVNQRPTYMVQRL